MFGCLYVIVCACMHGCVPVSVLVCMSVCSCVCENICVCMWVSMCECMSVCVYTYTCAHVCGGQRKILYTVPQMLTAFPLKQGLLLA